MDYFTERSSKLGKIFSVCTTLAMVVYLVAPLAAVLPQIASANSVPFIQITTVTDDDGHVPPFNCQTNPLFNPIKISGNGTGHGKVSQFHVLVDWGDGNISNPVATSFSPASGNNVDFTFSFNSITHTYTSTGNFTITARLYHSQDNGNDKTDATSLPITTCVHVPPPTNGSLTITKVVNGGTAQVSDFTLKVDSTVVTSGVVADFAAGTHVVSETGGPAGYTGVISGDCATNGNINIVAPNHYDCTITNTFSAPPNTPPTIVLNGSNPLDITVGNSYGEPGAVANDAEDGLGLVVSDITGFVNTLVIGTYHIFYNFTDSGSLPAAEVDRTVNINPGDTQCSDGVDNDGDGLVDLNDPGCLSLSDNSENQPPVITITGANPVQLVVNVDSYSEQGATADDAEDGNNISLQNSDINSSAVNTSVVGSYSVTYNFTDSDGAAAAEVTRTVNVVAGDNECNDTVDNDGDGLVDYPADSGCAAISDTSENEPPVITVPTELIMLTLGGSFNPMDHATASDAEDGSITGSMVIGGDTIDTNAIGDYFITYDVTDSDGAAAAQKSLTLHVRAECADSLDNDDDGKTDADDPGCHIDTNPGNEDTYNASDNDETDPADMCPNLDGIQIEVPEGLVLKDGVCVEPTDVTPPTSAFDEGRNHQIIDTELVSLSLTGQSSDNTGPQSDPKSGVASAEMTVYSIPNVLVDGELNGSAWEGLSCGQIPENAVPIEIVALNLVSVDPITVSWSHDLANPTQGVYCAIVHATDVAGNVEHTGIAGPFAYTFVPPPPPSPPSPTPSPTPPPPPSGGGGNGPLGFGGGSSGGSGGQVLGASTIAPSVLAGMTCNTEYLKEYMRINRQNNPEEVKKLQTFLNQNLGLSLPLTGYFGSLTHEGVNQFQLKYADQVLGPWLAHGLPNKKTPTGYVYKTTKWWINMLMCDSLNLPVPELP